ncbi:MAG: hypothetical protein JWP51_1872 [Bradyrhizobium sp.]|nr:hypothetical protein [Bradyrhizobium sp.]
MGFPWPVTEDELVLDDALDIAMRNFDLPHDQDEYAGVQSFAAEAIMEDWRGRQEQGCPRQQGHR